MSTPVGHQVMLYVEEMILVCVQLALALMWNFQEDFGIWFHVKPEREKTLVLKNIFANTSALTHPGETGI